MKLSKTSKLGLLIIGCLAILIWGINYLKGRDLFRTETIYYARYANVGGLETSSDVTLNGFKVGYVRDIHFDTDHSGDLIVKLAIHKDFKLPLGSKAEIVSSDILGSRVIKLKLSESEMMHQSYDTLGTALEADLKEQVSEQIAPIKAKAESLLASLDSAFTVVTYVFNEDTRQNLTESFVHINNTILNLERTSRNLDELMQAEKMNLIGIIQNLKNVTDHLDNNSEKIDNILTKFSSFSDTLAAVELNTSMNKLDATLTSLNQIVASIDSAQGSLGMLVNDPTLYRNMSRSTENLNRLLVDLRQNPKRYVHFSAFDLGKEIYVTQQTGKHHTENVTLKILITSSTKAIPLDSPVFQGVGDIKEEHQGKIYQYLTGEETSLEEIRKILNNVQKVFPDASIVAFKKGKRIKLERALKSLRR